MEWLIRGGGKESKTGRRRESKKRQAKWVEGKKGMPVFHEGTKRGKKHHGKNGIYGARGKGG